MKANDKVRNVPLAYNVIPFNVHSETRVEGKTKDVKSKVDWWKNELVGGMFLPNGTIKHEIKSTNCPLKNIKRPAWRSK